MVITRDKPRLHTEKIHGNIFLMLNEASNILINEGLRDHASEMMNRVAKSSSYNEALSIISQYVEVI